MSRYTRPRIPGGTLFLTINLADRDRPILLQHIETLRAAVSQVRARNPFEINAWVILPDHMHCIWTLPRGDSNYAQRIGAIKAIFSKEIRRSGFTPTPRRHRHGVAGAKVGVNPDLRGEVGIWQRRFWEHHIRSETDLQNHIAYCWNNPVKHGLVDHAQDWPYSTWHRDNP